MKQMRLAFTGFTMMALIMACCTSCDKNDTDPDNGGNNNGGDAPLTKEVTAQDLPFYYVLVENSNNLRVFYFTKEDGKIVAYMDGLGTRRAQTVESVEDGKLDFEPNPGVVYHFEFDKDEAYNMVLKSCTLSGSDATVKHAQLDKVTNAPKFSRDPGEGGAKIFQYTKTETYCAATDTYVYLYFDYASGPKWKRDLACGTRDFIDYYFVANNAGWKSGDETVFGVGINNWKGSGKPTMVLTSTVEEMQPNVIHTAFEL